MPPANNQPSDPNLRLIDAMSKLTHQLQRNLEFMQDQEDKAERTAKKRTVREEQEQMALFDDRLRPLSAQEKRRRRKQAQEETLFGPEVGPGRYTGSPVADNLPPDSEERVQPQPSVRKRSATEDIQALRNAYRGTRGSRRIRSALASWDQFARPVDVGGGTDQTGSAEDERTKAESMMAWAVLQEHGGPAFIRNLALEQYGFQRSLGWAQKAANQVGVGISQLEGSDNRWAQAATALPFMNSETAKGLQGFLGMAADHPVLSWLAYKGLTGAAHTIGGTFGNMRDFQAYGQQFGYGPPPLGQTILGFRNPLGNYGAAARVGAAAHAEINALKGEIPGQGFGSGLNEQQAQDVMSTLSSQGFAMNQISGGVGGTILSGIGAIPGIGGWLSGALAGLGGSGPSGDAANIAQNFMRPLMQRFPGLSAQDLGEFTPALRNAGTSINQLRDQLTNLGVEAQATKETVGTFASSLAQTGQAFESMGSSLQGGVAVGAGFTNATALDPQLAARFAQNPLFQGMMMSKYGILPSGLGDMNSGAFTGQSVATLQMLQHALAGLNRNKYEMVNGHQVLIQSGQQAVYDQIAQMTGMPSNIVKRMLGDQSGIAARSRAQTMLGDPTSGTGFWQYLDQNSTHTAKQWQVANQTWMDTVANTYQGTGVSKGQMQKIDQIHNLHQRATAYAEALANASKNDAWNQIQNNPNAQTVQVEFTGLAAKYFQQVPNSAAKVAANAGGTAYNTIYNSIPGDISGGAALARGH